MPVKLLGVIPCRWLILFPARDLSFDKISRFQDPLHTSDLTGDYRVVVEGITSEGEAVWATAEITVN